MDGFSDELWPNVAVGVRPWTLFDLVVLPLCRSSLELLVANLPPREKDCLRMETNTEENTAER